MTDYATFVGLDVHADRLSVHVLAAGADGAELWSGSIPNMADALGRLIGKFGKRGRALYCYEAGPCGYRVHRQITAAGHGCLVAAPSLIPRRSGERVKTDKRDACKLARLLRAGELEGIWVPDPAHEAMRDLVKARHQAQRRRKAAMQRVTSFLLRLGRHWTERPWTLAHRAWLDGQVFTEAGHGFLFGALRDDMAEAGAAVKRFEAEIVARLDGWPAGRLVEALRCLRGIDLVGAVTLAAAIGDPRRFGSAPALMAYFGLTPSEHSSGKRRRLGAITKTGDGESRRILVEAAWTHRMRARPGAAKTRRLEAQPQAIRAIAKACETRLNRRFSAMIAARKKPQVVAVAIAREQAGFVWAVAREVGAPGG